MKSLCVVLALFLTGCANQPAPTQTVIAQMNGLPSFKNDYLLFIQRSQFVPSDMEVAGHYETVLGFVGDYPTLADARKYLVDDVIKNQYYIDGETNFVVFHREATWTVDVKYPPTPKPTSTPTPTITIEDAK